MRLIFFLFLLFCLYMVPRTKLICEAHAGTTECRIVAKLPEVR